MSRWKKSLLGLALCAAVLLGVAIPAFGASGTVYLMAVNDRVFDATSENMPTVMGGVLYVPYTMLSIRDSGINLGVSALYSTTRRTVLVSNGQSGIVFDTQSNTAQDLQGNPVSARAMVRNSMVFLPIDYLCSYFGTINCSRVRTEYGTVIRVTNSAVVLRDLDFVDAAASQLAENLRKYLASLEGPSTPETPAPPTALPTLPPVVTTTPPAPSNPPVRPTAPQPPAPSNPPVRPTAPQPPTPSNPPDRPTAPQPSAEPSEEPSAPLVQAEVLPAFRWGAQGEDAARLLEERGEYALFLFTCEELRTQDDAVRRLAAAGHSIGLALTGEDLGTCAGQLEEGRRLLAEAALCPALIVSAGALDRRGREALAREGCAVWEADLLGRDYPSGVELAEALKPQRANYVELECGAGDAAFLQELLAAMDGTGCSLRQAAAPLLS